jgi:hypothetical protein
VLEGVVDNGAEELGLEHKVLEGRGVDANIVAAAGAGERRGRRQKQKEHTTRGQAQINETKRFERGRERS